MKTLSLMLGDKCNLRCSFCLCLDSLNKGKELSLENIYKFLDWQLKLYPDEQFRVEMFGGEPTLYWDKILKIYEQYKSYTNISWMIFTNGVFPKNVDIDILLEIFDEIIVSLEGPRENSLDRHPSNITYFKALTNLKYMVSKEPDKVGVGFAVLPDTDLDSVISFYEDLGVRYYNFEIVVHLNNDKSSDIDNPTLFKYLKIIYNRIIKHTLYNLDNPKLFTVPRELLSSSNYFSLFNKETHSCFKNFRALAPSGNIYFCRDLAANEDTLIKQADPKTIYRDSIKVPFNIKDLQLDEQSDTFSEDLLKYESYISCPNKSFESYNLIGYSMPWIKDKDFQDLVVKPIFYFSYMFFDLLHKYYAIGDEPPAKLIEKLKSDLSRYEIVLDYYTSIYDV